MTTVVAPIPASITAAFAPMSARRLLVFGGIALVAAGMLYGDIFAVFILHQNAGAQGDALIAASRSIVDPALEAGSAAAAREAAEERRESAWEVSSPRP